MTRIFARCTLASLTILGASFAGGLYAQAADAGQLAAVSGVSRAEAATMSLTELAAAKFNRDTRGDDRQTVTAAGTVMVDPARHAQLIAQSGITPDEAKGMTLTELAAGKFNAGSDADNRQVIIVSTRGPVRVGSQLASSAGLDPVAAQGMSLTEIAAAKFERDTGDDD